MNERIFFPRPIKFAESWLKRLSVWSLFSVAFCFCFVPADAADLATGSPPFNGHGSDVPAGPCLLLRNGNVLFGTASKIGDTVHVTRDDQSTIKLSGDQVAFIGQSIQQLYEYRRENRFGGDLKRIQSDIRWCLQNELVRVAAEDVLLARQLDPSNPQTIQLLRQVAARMKMHSASAGADNRHRPATIQTVSHDSSPIADDKSEELASPLPDDLTYQFTSRIQPILMNRCAGCHARGQTNEREFQIHPALASKWAPKTVAIENLQSVMKYVNRNQPALSSLRLRATDGHGGNRRSFGNSGSSMMRNLDLWLSRIQPSEDEWPVRQTSGVMAAQQTRQLEPTAPPKLGPIDFNPMHKQQVAVAKAVRPVNQAGTGIPTLPAPIESVSSGSTTMPSSSAPLRIRRLPKVQNPFDPEIFNRRFHGQ